MLHFGKLFTNVRVHFDLSQRPCTLGHAVPEHTARINHQLTKLQRTARAGLVMVTLHRLSSLQDTRVLCGTWERINYVFGLQPPTIVIGHSLDDEALIAESDGTPTGIGNDGLLRA